MNKRLQKSVQKIQNKISTKNSQQEGQIQKFNQENKDSDGSQSQGSELGEDEMSEQGEEGEDELFEEKSDDIDFNTVIKEDALAHNESDEDSEEDIIASTIKQKQSQKAGMSTNDLQKEFDQSFSKKQKVSQDKDQVAVGSSLKKNLETAKDDIIEVQQMMGKDSIPDASAAAELDFEYVAPSEPYYQIVRTFLTQYLDGIDQEQLSISDMADHILERASIGCVIASPLAPKDDPEKNKAFEKLSDAEFEKIAMSANAKRDVYGFITILSMSKNLGKEKWMTHIFNYIIKKAEVYLEDSHKLKTIIESKRVGLLVNERLVNMPPQTVPPLHTQLPEDLKFTKEQDDISDKKEFDYEFLIVISKFTVSNEIVNQVLEKDNFVPKRQDRLYYRWEDDILEASASYSFCYQSQFKEVDDEGNKSFITGPNPQAGGGKETQYRLIYLIDWKHYINNLPILEKIVEKKKKK